MRLAEAAHARYGFNDFKLKGGVLRGRGRDRGRHRADEALSRRRASRSIRTAPGRSRRRSACAATSGDVLAYAEDPCGAENGLFGPRGHGRVPPRHRPADGDQHDRHRLARRWATRSSCSRSTSRSPTRISGRMQGSVRVAQMCRDWGLTWGSHSNNHFDISLAMFTHVAAAAPGTGHGDRHALDLAGRPAPDQGAAQDRQGIRRRPQTGHR